MTNKLRVIQWATGNVGRHAVAAVHDHPDLELVGARVYSDAKAGRDVGEICGLGEIGVTATYDVDEIMALDADCVLYMAQGDWNPPAALDDVCRLLASGKNVVSTAVTAWIYPSSAGDEVVERLEAACQQGKTSFHGTGIQPGWAAEVLPLTMSGLFRRVESLLVQELMDYTSYDVPFVLFDVMGFGKPPDEKVPMDDPAIGALSFKAPLMLVAIGLGAAIDDYVWERQVAVTDKRSTSRRDESKPVPFLRNGSPTPRSSRPPGTERRTHHPPRRRSGAGVAERARLEGHRRGTSLDDAGIAYRHPRGGRHRSGLPGHRHARRACDRTRLCRRAGNPYLSRPAHHRRPRCAHERAQLRPLFDRHPGIDFELQSGDESRFIRYQEQHRIAHITGFHAWCGHCIDKDRDEVGPLFAECVAEGRWDHSGGRPSGMHGVDPNVLCRQLIGERQRQTNDAVLGRGVGQLQWEAFDRTG
jgi:hypothetical protein